LFFSFRNSLGAGRRLWAGKTSTPAQKEIRLFFCTTVLPQILLLSVIAQALTSAFLIGDKNL
jgi:hypothetical protein